MSPHDRLLQQIESMEVSGTERHWRVVPPDLARRTRAHHERVGDGLLTFLGNSDSLRMNRVVGLGRRGEASEQMIDRIIARFREAGLARFKLVLGRVPQAGEIASWLAKRNFTPHGGFTVLARDARRPVPRIDTTARVARARASDRAAIVRIHGEVFATPASRRSWSLASAADPETVHFLAFIGSQAAGVGAVRAEGDLAWLGGGGTLTRFRRRGIQSALIAARLRYAARKGCAWAWSETGKARPGRPDGSRRNLLRLGFEEIGVRTAYLWQDPDRPPRRRRGSGTRALRRVLESAVESARNRRTLHPLEEAEKR